VFWVLSLLTCVQYDFLPELQVYFPHQGAGDVCEAVGGYRAFLELAEFCRWGRAGWRC